MAENDVPQRSEGSSGPPSGGSDRERGLGSAEAASRLERDGPNEVPEKGSHPVLLFAQKFWGLSAWMLELIALLSFLLGKQADFAIALALLFVNAGLSFLEEERASAAVAALRHRLQVTTRVLRDGVWKPLPARQLVAGDVIRVRSGDFVPADVRIIDGTLQIDQSALTGESRELKKRANENLYSGSIVRQGEATATVAATGIRTYFGRTTQLVESARPKLHIEEVIARVVKWLLLIVGTLVSTSLAISVVRGVNLIEILPLLLVLLMSAVPVALPVMFTVSMALGSIELARRGVLVTRLSAAEDAANMDVLFADKTGTLTMNRLTLVGGRRRHRRRILATPERSSPRARSRCIRPDCATRPGSPEHSCAIPQATRPTSTPSRTSTPSSSRTCARGGPHRRRTLEACWTQPSECAGHFRHNAIAPDPNQRPSGGT